MLAGRVSAGSQAGASGGAAGAGAADLPGRDSSANAAAGGSSPAATDASAGAGASGAGGAAAADSGGVGGLVPSVQGAGAGAGDGGAGAAGASGSSAPNKIRVWIAGDSTVAKGNTPCPVGWGAEFQSHFADNVEVVNSAVGGRSVRTWLYDVGTTPGADGECVLATDASGKPVVQMRWQNMLDGMKPGDYLLIQFGINDSAPTCDRHVGLEAFKDSYGMMAKAARERGAQAIFITPVSALSCHGSTAVGTRGEYVTATQDAGSSDGVPVIDLHARSVALYQTLGLCPIPGGGDVSASTTGKVGDFFCNDHTHFERAGAEQIANLIADALHDQQLGLGAYLK